MQLQDFWHIVSERKVIVIVAFLATVLSALAGTILSPDKYEGTATILLDYDSSNPMNIANVAQQGLTSEEYLNTQIEIIKSRRIAEGVVDILKLDQVPDLIAGYRDAKEGNPLFFWEEPMNQGIKSWLVDNFLAKSLKVEMARDSRLINIRFYSPKAVLSADIANAFAKSYADYNLELKVRPFKDAGGWFLERLKEAKEYSDRAMVQLREYQQKKGIIAQQGGIYDDAVQRLDQLNRELAASKAKLFEAQIAQKRVDESNGNYESLTEVLASPFVQGLKGDKIKLETQLAELGERAGRGHPQYVRLQSMLDTVNLKLKTEMGNIVHSIRQDHDSAQRRMTQLASVVEGLKRDSTSANLSRYQMDSLARESETSKQVYEEILKKFNETLIQGDINRSNVFIVDQAAPQATKYSPKLAVNLAVSVLVGLFLGVGLALIFDYLDDTVKGAEAVEREFGIAVLGTVTGPAARG